MARYTFPPNEVVFTLPKDASVRYTLPPNIAVAVLAREERTATYLTRFENLSTYAAWEALGSYGAWERPD